MEIALATEEMDPQRVPLVDSNMAYAQYVISRPVNPSASVFKVGVVGGVGPL